MKRAFTLIEILVTIAILAIVASLILAGVDNRRHREDGKQSERFRSGPVMRFDVQRETTPPDYPDLYLVTDKTTGAQTLLVRFNQSCAVIPVASVAVEHP